MSHKEAKDDTSSAAAESMPVTSEVGSEGGSYADPTIQAATEKGHLRRVEQPQAEPRQPGRVAEEAGPEPQGPEDGVRTPDDTHIMPD
jgi:hypothetical protein